MYNGQGQVSSVSEKPFTDRWGKNITLYSFQIAGDNGWYRTGTTRPSCNQGDMIQFSFEQQGQNKKVDPNTIQVTGNAPQQQQPAQQRAVSAGGSNTRDDYWKNKEVYDKEVTQPRISYAAAQKSAVAVVTAALANDVLGFGSAKKADKMEMLLGYVDEVTNHFALKLDAGNEILADLKSGGGSSVAAQVVDEDAMYDQ